MLVVTGMYYDYYTLLIYINIYFCQKQVRNHGSVDGNDPYRLIYLNTLFPSWKTCLLKIRRCNFIKGNVSVEVEFEVLKHPTIPIVFFCLCIVDAFQLQIHFIVSCLLSFSQHQGHRFWSPKLNAFLYNLFWPWCFITAKEKKLAKTWAKHYNVGKTKCSILFKRSFAG